MLNHVLKINHRAKREKDMMKLNSIEDTYASSRLHFLTQFFLIRPTFDRSYYKPSNTIIHHLSLLRKNFGYNFTSNTANVTIYHRGVFVCKHTRAGK